MIQSSRADFRPTTARSFEMQPREQHVQSLQMGRSRPESYRKAHPTGLFTGDPAHAEAATSPGAAVAP